MFGFHVWDLLILLVFVGIIALVVGLVVWAVRKPTQVIIVPMNPQQPNPQQPYSGQPYQGAGQPGAQPSYPGAYQQPGQYPGQPPAQEPPQ